VGSNIVRSIFVLAVFTFLPASAVQPFQQPEGTASTRAAAMPDLSGVWTPARGARRGFGDTKDVAPMQPWAEEKFKAARVGAADEYDQGADELDPDSGISPRNCYPAGTPRIYNIPRPFEIIQAPGKVYLLYEWDHAVRRIYTDGRKRPEGMLQSYMGYSLGKWDGDTLVVETADMNDKTWVDGLGHPHTDALRVVERFRRVKADTLEIDVLIDDPKTYAKPWGGKKIFNLKPAWEIYEHENCEEFWETGESPYGSAEKPK